MSYKMKLCRFFPSRELFRMPASAVRHVGPVRGYIRIRKMKRAAFAIGDGRETFSWTA